MYNTPKRDLVTNLQVMLQNGDLRIARGLKEADALTDELMNFKTKITESGHDVYGARSGTHDDIVLSVAMGAWLATRDRWRVNSGMRLGGDGKMSAEEAREFMGAVRGGG